MPLKLLFVGMVGLMAMRRRDQGIEAQPQEPVVSNHVDRLALKPAPINPDWIISGNPVARVADHSQSGDEASATALWDCTAGEFRWFFHWDETVVIQEGEVRVTAEDGSVRLLKTGDIAYFRGGTWATWRIDTYVRKIAFLRKPFPEPLATLFRIRNAMRQKSFTSLSA
jgi:uncharacterized cupin superfamily protein